jgi:hypothetical protein
MDPLALAAVVGLVFAGQRLSSKDETPLTTDQMIMMKPTKKIEVTNRNFAQQDAPLDPKNIFSNTGRQFNDFRLTPKRETGAFTDLTPHGSREPYGQPVYDLYSRQGVSGKMNNLASIERQYVGRGIGVGPDVPAAGGFHQFFRVLPANINEERLTTLGGTFGGPANAVVPAGGPVAPAITHQAKDSKAWHRDPAQTRGQGQGGALTAPEGRPDQIKTRRLTIRDETGERTGDTLQIGAADYFVNQPYAAGTKTYTDTRLTRGTNNRSNPDRAGNGQRMNVRADPVGATGAASNLRSESIPFPVQAPAPLGHFNAYKDADHYKFNPFKANANPNATPQALDLAIQQLHNNCVVQPPLAAL